MYWAPLPPPTAVTLLSGHHQTEPWTLQYAVRVLEAYDVDIVFFYIPQLVQALRYDHLGYVQHYLLFAAKISQLFAHTIIWNMKANMFLFNKDGQATEPDSLKPRLDAIVDRIVNGLSGSDKDFYEREFEFFHKITSISGSLMPLVRSGGSKPEKKKKIDEEMAKIKVEVGVYLPTNPEGIVLDIDYTSGRPLQSHAKAPYMATFKDHDKKDAAQHRWMSVIFKVGDDCRQDLLCLQLIAIFKSIFQRAQLNLYLFPYRMVPTGPGCGVLEVVPRSISRDIMGRERVNGLHAWYRAQFGPENSVAYKRAQHNLVRSLAASSLVLYLLQIKDRHNGNIMFDEDGHIVHIDFGFMLGIAPGGGILEPAPFKLTAEMVDVLGGHVQAPSYRLFMHLLIKAFLTARNYADEIIDMVRMMQDSGLPCFRGEATVRALRDRFVLHKTERQAAEHMVACIRQSHENTRSVFYDRFQHLTNGIPYA
ncbi:hypothetical protein CXG81DRAFT_11848 [Caulochytrium protostelioides]|uniref:1-phosphatidylinositol 4-kinase n=1 Tax=Caulochytrium protostelioides TaxID=1555241 RepID=A0A4P9X8E3_9FUNG|nr:hypothetical protein CXG81DRAFT_11848 [Caulochytrium protostelioides]|eukprot:RKP01557.1 hypothetical protein CXG81DRAFT_11848 [Caulochytrium protostelioides]